MKALVYTGPEAMEFQDAPDPAHAAREVLIRIDRVGVCGSDMHAYFGHDARRPAPLILGHEAAGVITGGPRDGERVTINPLVSCGTCNACKTGRDNLCPDRQIISMPPREGAFAQWVAMPEANLVAVPDNVPLTKAALAEPLAVSWHAVRLGLAAVFAPGPALVLGGGAIGLAAALAFRAQGAGEVTIVEPNPARRAFLADRCGENVVAEADGHFALVVDAVGFAATRAAASAHTAPGGVILHIGLGEDTGGLDIRRMTLQEITFIGTYTYTPEDFRQTADAIFEGTLGELDWAEVRPLSQGKAVFADIASGRIASPKIVLDPWS